MLKELLKPPYQQIEELDLLVGSDNHIIPVKDLNEATQRIIAIINSLRDNNPDQENENLPRSNVFCDFDGVIRSKIFRNSSFKEKISIFRSLGRLIKITDYFTLWSNRIVVDTDDPRGRINQLIGDFIDNSGAISRFPFFTNRSLRRFFLFLNRINPKCDIDFNIGIEKINEQDSFSEKAIDILEQGQILFIIGSSFFDRRRIKKIIELCQQNNPLLLRNFYYLDTGRRIY